MKILAFSSSNSQHSINRTLAAYAARLVESADAKVIDIHDYEMPLFSVDREQQLGQPEPAKAFLQKIAEADALVISHAEHNGSYTAAYKNLFDWASRIERKVFQNKPTLLLSTSPGAGGAANALKLATESAPYFGANIVDAVSVPSFYDNFSIENNELSNLQIKAEIQHAINKLEKMFVA